MKVFTVHVCGLSCDDCLEICRSTYVIIIIIIIIHCESKKGFTPILGITLENVDRFNFFSLLDSARNLQ